MVKYGVHNNDNNDNNDNNTDGDHDHTMASDSANVVNDDLLLLFKIYSTAKCEMTRLVQFSFAHFLGIQDVKVLKQRLYVRSS